MQGVEFRRVKNPAVTVPLADLSISVRAGGTKLNMENQVPFIEAARFMFQWRKFLSSLDTHMKLTMAQKHFLSRE